MPVAIDPSALHVLVLYNVEPSWTPQEKQEVVSLSAQLGHALSHVGHPTTLVDLPHADLPAVLDQYDPLSYVVFNWCESIPGVPHSESLVAETLESLGFTFTGASGEALALSQNKQRVKNLLEKSTIPTPAWRVYDSPHADGWDLFPAIVKPIHEHCSEGITPASVVMTEAELENRIAYILDSYRQAALVEDFIDGREFHVALWGNGNIEVLPPAEMDFSDFSDVHDRLCTYEAKFVPGSVHYEGIKTLLPAPLHEDELHALEETCRAAYRLLQCRDYGRIDLRMRDGVCFVLDVNPNADISNDASLACAAEAEGYSYGETASRIVRLAARRHPVWGKGGLIGPLCAAEDSNH